MTRPRPRMIAIGAALLLMLAALTFLPRGDDDEGAIRPSGEDPDTRYVAAGTAGASAITAEMRAQIDRVVTAGRVVGRVGTKASAVQLADRLVRCVDLDGQRYCLGAGWTEDTEAQVRARVASAARTAARTSGRLNTGDLDAAAALRRAARMSPAARATAERTELEMAARSVAKVWLLRHEIEGVPLPAGFLEDHPEARAETATTSAPATRSEGTKAPTPSKSPSATASAKPTTKPTTTAAPSAKPKVKKFADYPRSSKVVKSNRVASQARTYWCGPTTMQMIAWGWQGTPRKQSHWASLLGTTSGGTAITDMVRVVNQQTGWDRKDRAGPYITLDIGSWSFNQWMLLMMRHVHDYRAPVILHPILLKRFYPYLDDDASGHFQVGRGYDKAGKRPTRLGYFEPWNQQRFDPSEPYIARVQWRDAYKSYRANQTHFAHNVGV